MTTDFSRQEENLPEDFSYKGLTEKARKRRTKAETEEIERKKFKDKLKSIGFKRVEGGGREH